MTFRYSLVSDLHLDFPHPKTPAMEQFVIVAGDCANGLLGLKYLSKLKRKGHTVFAVDGNHEHYANRAQGRTIADTEKAFYAGLDQALFYDVPDEPLRIIGCNGWYNVEDERHWLGYMNDGRNCAADAVMVNEKAREQALWMEAQLAMVPTGTRAIVVTHTAPCEESLDPKYEGSSGNDYYVNKLMTPLLAGFREKIAIWHHGHTHAAVDVVKDGVRIVTNPRGYPSENPSWHPLTVEV